MPCKPWVCTVKNSCCNKSSTCLRFRKTTLDSIGIRRSVSVSLRRVGHVEGPQFRRPVVFQHQSDTVEGRGTSRRSDHWRRGSGRQRTNVNNIVIALFFAIRCRQVDFDDGLSGTRSFLGRCRRDNEFDIATVAFDDAVAEVKVDLFGDVIDRRRGR